ncbi:nitrate- and nitrite sensing domain-containing protein [Planobispora siamensis]|uniref:histidine kinase n=1 Tax=Planobispora siamensis TaxID=936338 RepID=A0A8J3WNK4_9ACTN|nr:nitrate- and nitrite sensing domain-containing protein [Planobispora siamensis]GIH93976.1 ATPase [Planobispora siamensis]
MASSRSIRFKVSALLVVPLTSLVALWGFAATTTVGDAVGMLNVSALHDGVIKPGDALLIALQREHLMSAEYLASRSDADRSTLVSQRTTTDQAMERLREDSADESTQSALTPEMKVLFDALMTRVGQLDATRAKIDEGRIEIADLPREFAPMPDVFQRLVSIMAIDNDPETQAVIKVGYAKDFLTRQRAIAAGATAQERPLSPRELQLFREFSTTRNFLLTQAMADMQAELGDPFTEVVGSPVYSRFIAMEERLLAGEAVRHAAWRSVADDLEAAIQVNISQATVILTDRAVPPAVTIFVRAGAAGALGLVAVIVSLAVSYRVGRGLTRELAGVRQAAVEMAETRLPRIMERLRRGQDVDVEAEVPGIERLGSTSEVHAVAAAFDSVGRRAVDAAVEQARLREGVAHAFRNLARRKQSLLQRQLKLLDGMQKQTEDPQALENLFVLDHLTTRMRRHAEGLVILSGGAVGRRWRSAVPMEDVLRGAAAQVEDYARVRIYPMPDGTLVGGAVADMMHLFAEIIENATVFSPPGAEVSVRGERVGRGFAVEIEDRGLGLPQDKRDAINARLASPPEFDPAETDRLGFSVVGLLAARHGVKVMLRPSPYGGTGVVILVPEPLLGVPEPVLTGAGEPHAGHFGSGAAAEPVRSVAPDDLSGLSGLAAQIPAARAHSELDGRRTPQRRNGGLPRRVRQANLAPSLRQEPGRVPADETTETTPQKAERSPEEARALLSSLQSGWRRGRSESEDTGGEGA